jgi:hypothetical protein
LAAPVPVAGIFNIFKNLPSISFGDSGFGSFLWSGCWLAVFPGISFARSGYQFDSIVSDDGIMQLAQAGIYQGPAAIQEYSSFLIDTSPFLKKTGQAKIEIRYGGLVADEDTSTTKNGQCVFNVGVTMYHLTDETTSAYAAEYNFPIMFKAFFPVGKKRLARMYTLQMDSLNKSLRAF